MNKLYKLLTIVIIISTLMGACGRKNIPSTEVVPGSQRSTKHIHTPTYYFHASFNECANRQPARGGI